MKSLPTLLLLGSITGILIAPSALTHAQSTAPPCPERFLYSLGSQFFYASKSCVDGQSMSEVLVFAKVVKTGCEGNQCANDQVPVWVIPGTNGTIEGEGGSGGAFEKVPADANLLTEFGNSAVALTLGYPKFVSANVAGTDRIFKVYKLTYLRADGGRPDILTGVEVDALPAGQTAIPATEVGDAENPVAITVRIGRADEIFQCLFESNTSPGEGNGGGGDAPDGGTGQ